MRWSSMARRALGTLDRSRGETSVNVAVKSSAPLDILVEQMGRINYGRRVIGESKGITGSVALAGSELNGWEIYPLPLDNIKDLSFKPPHKGTTEAVDNARILSRKFYAQ